ncbi:MAG TPA: hypothetical protein VF038_09830 [Usitatibacter sp.]
MDRNSWLSDLRHAGSPQETLALARRFLAAWGPMEIALLPPGAWPSVPPSSVEELVDAALRIDRVHASYAQTGGPAVLREILSFFTHAAIRALQLELDRCRAPDGGARD